jgi:NAD(P)-dependent dehydrogenase (short-subunit alcohol dehydrogenase family)
MSLFLVTAASRSVGLELCRMLVARGDRVIACCRRPSVELLSLGVRIEPGVDLRSVDSMADLALALRDARLDGIFFTTETPAGVEEQFQLLCLGPVRLARALRAHLAHGATLFLVGDPLGSPVARTLLDLAADLLREEHADLEVVAQPNFAAETHTPIT